ncbi:hypothetical protein ABPG74_004291 [Tetrahymena malaccensis]
MGCCTTKQPNQKKQIADKQNGTLPPIQQTPIKLADPNKNNLEENKTTINTENKQKVEQLNGNAQNGIQVEQNKNSTPTPQQNQNIAENKYNQNNNNSSNNNNILQQNNELKEQNSQKQENSIIKKVNTITIKEEDISVQIKKKEQENKEPNTIKEFSQTLSIQQMRMSKVDKQTVNADPVQQKQEKSKHDSDYELQDEPETNMNNYRQQQTFQNKQMKDNILNKHMRSIMNSIKTNEYVSKTCYSTPPILYVDTDANSKGEWMQIETFGVYGQAEQNQNNKNFMDD